MSVPVTPEMLAAAAAVLERELRDVLEPSKSRAIAEEAVRAALATVPAQPQRDAPTPEEQAAIVGARS